MRMIASFEIPYRQFLGPEGRETETMPAFARDPAALLPLYRAMVLTRTFDSKAISLQRTGRLGTYPPCLGQEAIGVGLASAMEPNDVLLPSYREQAAQLWRGVSPLEILLYWGGDERGSDFAGPRHDFPICVPVSSQAPHAVGVALAMKLKGERRVAVCCLGDGGTSKGDFYEAINLAGAMQLPAVFVVANNQWAISVPRSAQTGAVSLAQKAVAAGIPGEQVDGNDVIAVADAARRAIETARSGGGSTLIEAITYRLADHTTVDDARRYRDDSEVSRHWELEPIARLRRYLTEKGAWSKADEERLLVDCAAEINAAADRYLAIQPQPPATMFDHLYAQLPAEYAAQRQEAAAEADEHA
ncbi:MAG TPA: pyruvate dehydrogenase (acetyl-transferring) E1 component subunit alpha [Candidatus Acidoferrum sp.]|nr:pyruvate dehydrogenase (acetyl-transferring) E1 component subunit alpha [Candidatus Acidoferrum sp.]